jgi:hypothetical protein
VKGRRRIAVRERDREREREIERRCCVTGEREEESRKGRIEKWDWMRAIISWEIIDH